jgi:pimeloyl-ACP methyl ester carboxylesterase
MPILRSPVPDDSNLDSLPSQGELNNDRANRTTWARTRTIGHLGRHDRRTCVFFVFDPSSRELQLNFRAVDITWRTGPDKVTVGLRPMNRILVYGLLVGLAGWLSAGGPAVGRSPPRNSPGRTARPAPTYRLLPVPVRHTHSTCCYPRQSVARAAAEGPDTRPLVWVLDGAGDLRGCSNALTEANLLAGSPIELAVFGWSHGYRQLLRDQIDMDHARAQGVRFAAAVLERKAMEPGRRVVVVSHSAGCAVALSAADMLPPDAIDRMILLAPSVSTGFDTRPALWSAREGVDVFCSRKDWVALGFVTRVVGTTDRFTGRAAGRYGFQPTTELSEIEAARLRQHFWSPDVAWTGHTGGHHGMHTPAFLHAYVFPMIGARVQP